jgi:hypothetical protein
MVLKFGQRIFNATQEGGGGGGAAGFKQFFETHKNKNQVDKHATLDFSVQLEKYQVPVPFILFNIKSLLLITIHIKLMYLNHVLCFIQSFQCLALR